MSERYTRYSTTNDVMKEFLIYGAKLTELGFPILPAVDCKPTDTIDFCSSLSRNLKGHNKLNVNFYIDDEKFTRVWNDVSRYEEHLSCFQSVCGLDFSIDTRMPLVMQMWNKYRSMALDWYLSFKGVKVIPNVYITPYKGREWLLDGFPKHSTICCSTNGRMRYKGAREEFCQGFYEMCERLEPMRVVVVGSFPEELKDMVPVVLLKNKQRKENLKEWKN